MGNRRKSREYALQLLYARELSGRQMDEISPLFWKDRPVPTQTSGYTNKIVSGVLRHTVVIDASIEQNSSNWKISRMSHVDRNILRIAVYEFMYEDSPPVVVINEAIEVAKRYGDGESGQFVNGVLDAIRKSLPTRNVKE
ncbi:MAG: transcription antitermination factor NusB [Acidobacteria bacterium]|nr:transcription antitermination factor NusB [Acidobacteriota bacterium]